jgi:hypothetical protein
VRLGGITLVACALLSASQTSAQETCDLDGNGSVGNCVDPGSDGGPTPDGGRGSAA